MIREDYFVELVKDCIRTCHVLKSVTEGSDVDDLSGGLNDSEKGVEDLGRCVNQIKPTLPTITSDPRIVSRIDFVVRERANHPRYLREQHSESTEESLIAWRMEMLEILRVFDVRGQQLSIATASK